MVVNRIAKHLLLPKDEELVRYLEKHSRHYILDGKKIVPVGLLEWAKWIEDSNNKRIALDFVGKVKISTVFLGIDHSFGRPGPPILFETMVFGGKFNSEQRRYATYEQAEAGHKRWLNKITKGK